MKQFSFEEIQEVRKLFTEARGTLHTDAEVELLSQQVGLALNSDEVRLLFDLAEESLSGSRAKEYIDDIYVSEKKVVESAGLDKALQSFENAVQKTFFSLKKRGPDVQEQATTANRATMRTRKQDAVIKQPLGWGNGFLSFLIDAAIVCFSSFFFAYLILPEIPEVWSSLGAEAQYLYYIPVSFGLLPLVSLGYLGIFGSLETPSIGLTLVNGEIVNEKGGYLDKFPLILRASATPVSFLLFGILSPLLGLPRLHDVLMGTKLIRKIQRVQRTKP